jgi:hypothetical protein
MMPIAAAKLFLVGGKERISYLRSTSDRARKESKAAPSDQVKNREEITY